jgi:uncharacterized membrane protein YhaH (DUF805 family)
MHSILRLCFGLQEPVRQGTYVRCGAVLMALKYAVDAGLVWLAAGRTWTPVSYFSPLFSTREAQVGPAPQWLWIALSAWALPFLWIGVSMTLRRTIDSGFSPWLCLLFFVPVLNWLLIAVLCFAPSRPSTRTADQVHALSRLRAALQGVAAGVGIGVVSVVLHVLLFKSYSAAPFLGTPFTMGAAAGFLYNRDHERPKTAGLGALTVGIAGLATLLLALEGALCVVMALAIALPLGALGALIGAVIARERRASTPATAAFLILLVPLSGAVDSRLGVTPLREVSTAVEIDAPPEHVWPHVVAFAEIATPPQWFFRLGIAYPVRARLLGHGAGAIRRCEFSTGAFVEPITAWEEPWRLAFSVAEQPPPLHEWSPYRHVYAQHLLETLRSRRGEFRLVALPGGRTRLEGSTWYELSLAPQSYWAFFSDLVIHRIHTRVLEHIRAEVSAGRERGAK